MWIPSKYAIVSYHYHCQSKITSALLLQGQNNGLQTCFSLVSQCIERRQLQTLIMDALHHISVLAGLCPL